MAPASIRDVAQHAGVRLGTVSNVLNRPGEVSAESIRRVHEAIEALGYVRNDAARKLARRVSTTVGFVVLDGQNPFFGDVVRGAEDEASGHGIAILYGNTDEDVEARAHVPRPLRGAAGARRAHLALRRHQPPPRAAALARHPGGARRPVQRRRPVQSRSTASTGAHGGEHLIATGRRRIAFVGGPFDIRQVNDRLAGARAAAENAAEHVGSRSSRPTR